MNTPNIVGLLMAALGGAAVGLERQWSGHAEAPGARFAGIRTFTMLGAVGGLSGWLWTAGNDERLSRRPRARERPAQPTTEVDAAWHRVRLLNGSNARIYKLAWSRDVQMAVIGGDGGLLETPLHQQALTLAPGQRADLLLDLTGLAVGTEVHLESQAFAEADAGLVGMMGMGGRGMRFMMGGPSNVPNGSRCA